MADYGQVIFFSLIGGVVSLAGGMLLLSRRNTAEALARVAAPFAAGALLGAAFFDLLPEAIELSPNGSAVRWTLAGIVLFFLLEHFLHWFHHHHEHPKKAESPTIPLIVIGDTVHNFIDGLAIGAAFLISPGTGIVTTLAVAAHEIPQEIGDFGVLLKLGMERKKVLLVNFLSALATVLGAVFAFWAGSEFELPLAALLAATAGMFIYIAASDLIPTIHEEAKGRAARTAALLLILGVLSVGALTQFAHQYTDTDSNNSEASSNHDDNETQNEH